MSDDQSARAGRIRVSLSAPQIERLEEEARREGVDIVEMARRALEVGIEVLSTGGGVERSTDDVPLRAARRGPSLVSLRRTLRPQVAARRETGIR